MQVYMYTYMCIYTHIYTWWKYVDCFCAGNLSVGVFICDAPRGECVGAEGCARVFNGTYTLVNKATFCELVLVLWNHPSMCEDLVCCLSMSQKGVAHKGPGRPMRARPLRVRPMRARPIRAPGGP